MTTIITEKRESDLKRDGWKSVKRFEKYRL